MNKILKKVELLENVIEYQLQSKLIAEHAKPGQFIILRTNDDSERIPFTIYDFDKEQGTINILVQTVGASTLELSLKNEGDFVNDLVGPLGNPTDLSEFKKVLLVAGGIGSAVIFPQAKLLKSKGVRVDVVLGARNNELILKADEFRNNCDNLHIVTDDGSSGKKGFVTTVVGELIENGENYDAVFAVGPMIMMKAVCDLTKKFNIKTIVSMNSIMVDGTGMCGCCRLNYDGKIKYACIDGPEFDGHKVDFEEALSRLKVYGEIEKEHKCRMESYISKKN